MSAAAGKSAAAEKGAAAEKTAATGEGSAQSRDEALALIGVGATLGGHRILEEVSLRVARGEVVGLVGRNGAGKTTLLRVASRSIEPDRGKVEIAGRDVRRLSRRALARLVATVPQDMHVPFPYRAGEIVLMGRTPHQGLLGFESARDIELAHEALDRVGIAALADRPIHTLSGGERQLVLFARALTQQPGWLLLDEPTAFLDLRHRIDVLRVVRDFAARGGGALVVSHDLGLAARICDRLVVLAHGGVCAEGTPAEVLTAEVLREAFGMEAYVMAAPDGSPLVVPRV
jgi:iron complex transport system ATP-binding protein